MKKYFLPLVLSVLLFSCEKNEKDNPPKLSALTKEVITQPTTTQQRQGHELLSNEEKEGLWNTKLNAILINDNEQLDDDQRAIVHSILDMLTTYGVKNLTECPKIVERFLDVSLSQFSDHFT